MPRTQPAAVSASLAGALATPTAPDALGDIVPAGSRVLVICGATGTTVTAQTTGTDSGLALPDAGGTVAPNTARLFGPFPSRLFAQADDATVGPNAVLVDYTSTTTVTRVVL